MRKIKVLVVAVTIALMVMGVGYAGLYQSNLLGTVNGTYGYISVVANYLQSQSGTVKKDWDKDNAILVSYDNILPGETKFVRVELANNGNVAARWTGIKISNLVNTNGLTFTITNRGDQTKTFSVSTPLDAAKTIDAATIKAGNGNANLDIAPNGSKYTIDIKVTLPSDVNESAFNGKKPFSFTIENIFDVAK